MDNLLQKALTATRESRQIEFKETFDVSSAGEWCEVIKDIVAIANAGGGVILFGVNNHGTATGFDIKAVVEIDPADMTNKIHKYSGVQFSDFEITEEQKGAHKVAALRIQSVSIPIVFTKPGTYDIGGGKQKTAFKEGSLYFRHGAKSEPGNSEDIRKVIERQLEAIRKDWIRGVRKVVTAPPGSQMVVMPREMKESDSHHATPIRIVDDPNAPAFRKIDPDVSHPFRTNEVLQKLNTKLASEIKLTPHDILCMRRLYSFDENSTFCYKPTFSAIQFSEAFIDWIMQKYEADPSFFEKVKQECHDKRFELGLASRESGRRRWSK